MTLAEAHKTGRKYRRKDVTNWIIYRIDTRNQINMLDAVDAIADDWEVEPEVYEVECVWKHDNYRTYPDKKSREFLWGELIGKRTKLTIEVLD